MSFSIETDTDPLTRAFRELAKPEAQFRRESLREGAVLLANAARSRAKGSIGATIHAGAVVNEGGAVLAAKITVTHPGAKPMEFGRQRYYEGYKGRNVKGGRKVRRSGQRARPYLGVKTGGAAVGETMPKAAENLGAAYEREFERLAQ